MRLELASCKQHDRCSGAWFAYHGGLLAPALDLKHLRWQILRGGDVGVGLLYNDLGVRDAAPTSAHSRGWGFFRVWVKSCFKRVFSGGKNTYQRPLRGWPEHKLVGSHLQRKDRQHT